MGTVAKITSGTDLMSKLVTSLNALVDSNNTIGQYSFSGSATLGTTPYAVVFDSNDTQAGLFTHSTTTNSSRFTVSAAGIYRFTAQLQVNHLTTGTGQCVAWFRKNGTTEIPNSAARISANGVTNTDVLVVDVIVSLTASDYIELMSLCTVASEWQLTGTVSSGTSPNIIPVTPAVIMTAIAFPS